MSKFDLNSTHDLPDHTGPHGVCTGRETPDYLLRAQWCTCPDPVIFRTHLGVMCTCCAGRIETDLLYRHFNRERPAARGPKHIL